jgi:hypothetical protein
MKNFKIFVLGMVLGLGLCGTTKAQTFRYSNKPKKGPVILVGGVSLLTASILENNAQGEWVYSYSQRTNSFKKNYVRPNILLNTPVNIVFGVGITLTATGLISSLFVK